MVHQGSEFQIQAHEDFGSRRVQIFLSVFFTPREAERMRLRVDISDSDTFVVSEIGDFHPLRDRCCEGEVESARLSIYRSSWSWFWKSFFSTRTCTKTKKVSWQLEGSPKRSEKNHVCRLSIICARKSRVNSNLNFLSRLAFLRNRRAERSPFFSQKKDSFPRLSTVRFFIRCHFQKWGFEASPQCQHRNQKWIDPL